MTELEAFLTEEHAEGAQDSSGRFTLSQEKALEKLAAYQLPRDTAWILKIVQAAVASGASKLEISQKSMLTEFRWDPRESFSNLELETAFQEFGQTQSPSLNALRIGLWSVALQSRQPFGIALPGASDSSIWDGAAFQHRACKLVGGLIVLQVSLHTSKREPVEAHVVHTRLLEELQLYAHSCPIPLTVDGLHIDGLQLSPTCGFTPKTHPVLLGWARVDAPTLPIPPGYFAENQRTDLKLLFKVEPKLSEPASAACLLTAHVTSSALGGANLQTGPSLIHWVKYGVIVDCEELALKHYALSCALYASAEGLRSDLSGFRVARDETYLQRRNAVCAAFAPLLKRATVDCGERSAPPAAKSNHTTAIVAGSAAYLVITGHPLLALFGAPGVLLGMLVYKYSSQQNNRAGGKLEESLTDELTTLRYKWNAAFCGGPP